jgi:hypothetical protein
LRRSSSFFKSLGMTMVVVSRSTDLGIVYHIEIYYNIICAYVLSGSPFPEDP